MCRYFLYSLLACAHMLVASPAIAATARDYSEQGVIPPVVEPEDSEPRGFFSIADDILEVFGDSYLGTKPQNSAKYPIVLLHGFLGWDQVFHLDYFYHIRKALEDDGFKVYTPQVAPVASVEVRAAQLAPLLDRIFEETGAEKVNLIAHSMGGLDARYLITHGYGDRIASLTMVGTPNHGSPVPDLVFKVFGTHNPLFKAFEYIAAGFLGKGHYKPSDLDLKENLWNLSKEFMEGYFNVYYRDNPNIYYQSYAGVSSVGGYKTGDVLDLLLAPFVPAFKYGDRSDGLVTIESAQWGRFRGIVSADHVNLVGQLFGKTSSRFDHVKFYKKISWELVDMGF